MDMNPADLAEAYAAIRGWLPQAAWEALFTVEALQSLAPRRGSKGIIPTLHLLVRLPDATRQHHMVLIDNPNWNAWESRTAMMTDMGRALAWKQGTVVAIRLVSEAWMRKMTEQEARERARTQRTIASYPDRQEIVMVFGSTLDGRMVGCWAALHRDKVARIRAVGKWTVTWSEIGELHAHHQALLDYFWRGYREGYLARRATEEDI